MAEHYYTKNPTSSMKLKKIEINFHSKNFSLFTSSGVFSKDKPDFASLILCESVHDKIQGKILDMGCGYGLIGITMLKIKPSNKKLEVVFSDVNERALEMTRKNLELNKLKAKVISSDGADNITEEFDHVLLNPPMAAGRKVCFKMILDSYKILKNEGSLWVVARHQKGGKLIKEHMNEVFGNAEDTARKSGFHVYVSKKG